QKFTWLGLPLLQATSLALAAAIERPNEDAEKEAARVLNKPFEPMHFATGKKTVEQFHSIDDTMGVRIST
ncbi:hypothetical protein LY76DRAFT_511402, partial [Colletotrichum caudatum]